MSGMRALELLRGTPYACGPRGRTPPSPGPRLAGLFQRRGMTLVQRRSTAASSSASGDVGQEAEAVRRGQWVTYDILVKSMPAELDAEVQLDMNLGNLLATMCGALLAAVWCAKSAAWEAWVASTSASVSASDGAMLEMLEKAPQLTQVALVFAVAWQVGSLFLFAWPRYISQRQYMAGLLGHLKPEAADTPAAHAAAQQGECRRRIRVGFLRAVVAVLVNAGASAAFGCPTYAIFCLELAAALLVMAVVDARV